MAGTITGKIVSISPEGNAVSDIANDRLRVVPTESANVTCDGHVTSKIFPADHDQPEMTFMALMGHSGFLELTLVGDNISKFLGIQPGVDVTVSW
ncbi:MAG: hypothetical protein KDA87_13215 [Planctomycetales bacterium]|nr:hypothetical protein [Planctomycetales bacterium]